MNLSIDLAENPGFRLVLKDYQEEALKLLWSTNIGQSSADVWYGVNITLEGKRTISRAAIINFLNAMVDNGILDYTETTGKGGYRRIYTAAVSEDEFWTMIAKETHDKLTEASGNLDLFKF